MNTYVDNSKNKYYNRIDMNSKFTNTNKLCAEDLFAALKEKDISAEDFTEELKLLLSSFFNCSVNSRGKNITVNFLNGQKFKITVKNVKR